MTTEDELQTVVKEAKTGFDLMARLKGQGRREGAQTVYLDEVTAEALGGSDDILNVLGTPTGRKTNWGVLGNIVEILAEDPEADVSDLRTEAIALRLELEKSSLTFHLRAVPEIIVKDARRQALKAYGAKGAVPDENAQDFNDFINAVLFSATIFKTVDADGAEETGKLSVEQAESLHDFLPRSQYKKLYEKLQDIQFKNSIADSVVSDLDF